jgi:hypothetical protein
MTRAAAHHLEIHLGVQYVMCPLERAPRLRLRVAVDGREVLCGEFPNGPANGPRIRCEELAAGHHTVEAEAVALDPARPCTVRPFRRTFQLQRNLWMALYCAVHPADDPLRRVNRFECRLQDREIGYR